jgi:hypothetical protein
MADLTKRWEETAQEHLLGKKIISVKYMTTSEAKESGWHQRPLCFCLNDGTWIIPQRDDEGNDGGALYVANPKDEKDDTILPVIGLED